MPSAHFLVDLRKEECNYISFHISSNVRQTFAKQCCAVLSRHTVLCRTAEVISCRVLEGTVKQTHECSALKRAPCLSSDRYSWPKSTSSPTQPRAASTSTHTTHASLTSPTWWAVTHPEGLAGYHCLVTGGSGTATWGRWRGECGSASRIRPCKR